MPNNRDDNLQFSISLELQDSLKDLTRFKDEMYALRQEFKGIKQTLKGQELAEYYAKADSPMKAFLKDLDKVNKTLAEQREKLHNAELYNPNQIKKIRDSIQKLETARKDIYLGARDNKIFGVEQKSINLQYKQAIRDIQKQYTEQAKVNALQREQNVLAERQKATESIKAKITDSEKAELAEMLKESKEISRARAEERLQRDRDVKAQLKEFETQRQQDAEKELFKFETPDEFKLYELNEQLKQARENFKTAFAEGDLQGLEKAKIEIRALSKEQGRLENQTKKTASSWQKLLGRIKNISIYRTIRSAIKWLTSGIQEGIKGLVQFDDGFNQTFTNINASLNQVRTTMAIGWASTLQALEPTITALADGLTDLVNSFNLAMAKMNGKDTYVKAKKYAKDYADEVNGVKSVLADFDKFRALEDSDQIDPAELFEEGDVEEDANKVSDIMVSMLTTIKEVGNAIKDIIKSVLESGALQAILTVVSGVVKAIASIFTWLNKIGALKGIIIGLTGAFLAYKAATFLAAAGQAAVWVTAHPLLTGVMVAAIAVITGITSSLSNLAKTSQSISTVKDITALADGGFTTANFIATNENGVREWVGKNGNATAVVNDSQMSELMYQAVKDGCYEGVIGALSDADTYGSTNTSTTANVQIQGETIFTIVKDVAARQGLKFSKV